MDLLEHGWGNFKVLSLSSTLHKRPKREGVKSDKNGSELRPVRRLEGVGRPVKMRLLKCGFVMFPVSRRRPFGGKKRRSRFGTIKTKKSNIVAMQNCEAVAIGLSKKHSALFRSQNPIRFATPLHHPTLSLTHFWEGVNVYTHASHFEASEIKQKLISLND